MSILVFNLDFGGAVLDIKILVRKGVPETLELLTKAEKNSVVGDELREKTEISGDRLKILVAEGVLERSEEKVLARAVPMKRRIATYNIADKGKRLVEICENLSEEEAKDFLRVSSRQLDMLRFFLKEGPKRAREISDTKPDVLLRMVKRVLLNKKVEDVEEKRNVYRLKRTYTLTEKGRKISKALQTIRPL